MMRQPRTMMGPPALTVEAGVSGGKGWGGRGSKCSVLRPPAPPAPTAPGHSTGGEDGRRPGWAAGRGQWKQATMQKRRHQDLGGGHQ